MNPPTRELKKGEVPRYLYNNCPKPIPPPPRRPRKSIFSAAPKVIRERQLKKDKAPALASQVNPRTKFLKDYEEQYSRLQLQTELLELLGLDEGRQPAAVEKQKSSKPKFAKRETFEEFNARMSSRPNGTAISAEQERPTGPISQNKPRRRRRAAPKCLPSDHVSSVAATEVDDGPPAENLIEQIYNAYHIQPRRVYSYIENPSPDQNYQNGPQPGKSILAPARPSFLRIARPMWTPPKPDPRLAQMLKDNAPRTPRGVEIIRDQKVKSRGSKATGHLERKFAALGLSSLITPRALETKGIQSALAPLTKTMIEGVIAKDMSIPSRLKPFVPRNVKVDKNNKAYKNTTLPHLPTN